MFKFYLKLLLIVNRHRLFTVVSLLVLALISGGLLTRTKFNNDISMMLPEHSEAAKTFRFIAQTGLTNKVIISLRLNDDKHAVADMTAYVDQLVKKLDSPLISRVDYRISAGSPLDDLNAMTPLIPQVTGSAAVEKLERMLDPAQSQKKINVIYRKLTSFMGTGQLELTRNDPFDLKKGLLKKLQGFSRIWGYQMAQGQNYFISRDLREAMLVLDTKVKGTDGLHAKALITMLRQALADLPAWLTADIISSHLRSLSNEKVIKRDIRLTLTLSFIGFLLLFSLFFKYDFRCLLLMLVPALATLYMLAIMSLGFNALSLFVIGLGGVIIGIAVDYGIHVYAAMASGRRIRGPVAIAKPLLAGGLTTCCVFVVFIFSGTPGYCQLGIFAGGSILICLALTLVVLPALLPKQPFPEFTDNLLSRLTDFVTLHPKPFVFIWLILFSGAIYLFSQVTFNNNLQQLDGSEAAIGIAEQRFHKAWSSKAQPAILAVAAKSVAAARLKAEKISHLLRHKVKGEFFSITDIWPSAETRMANLKTWQAFAASGKLDKLEQQVRRQAEAKGFDRTLFQPFFSGIRTGISQAQQQQLPGMLAAIAQRTTKRVGEQHIVFIFFPDQAALVKKVRTLFSSRPDCFIISRNAFRQMLFEAVTGRIVTLALWAIGVVCLITFLAFRRVGQTLLALLPVGSAIIGSGAFFVLFNIPVNAATCIGSIVVVGLAVDYGIFMVDSLKNNSSKHVLAAIVLSSLTTLIGAGAVIFAQHPMLHSVGMILYGGITIAALTALIIIPAIWTLRK